MKFTLLRFQGRVSRWIDEPSSDNKAVARILFVLLLAIVPAITVLAMAATGNGPAQVILAGVAFCVLVWTLYPERKN